MGRDAREDDIRDGRQGDVAGEGSGREQKREDGGVWPWDLCKTTKVKSADREDVQMM